MGSYFVTSYVIKDDNIILLGLSITSVSPPLNISINIIRELADEFRKDFEKGIAIFSNTEADDKVQLIVAVSDGLTKQGYHAGNIARSIANKIGGSGGGRPQMAQAGGKDIEKLKQVFDNINEFIKKN